MSKLIILGCGSSLGSPWITNYWGNCDKNNPYNKRTRCSAYIQKGSLSVLIDSSPDIKKQMLDNKIKNIDYVLYTHEHADQTSGIFELRPFFWKNKKKINVFADRRTLKLLMKRLKILKETNDGFIVAEEDLKLRGHGDLLGFQQSGIKNFKFADPIHHKDLFILAENNIKNFNSQNIKQYQLLLKLFDKSGLINNISE